MAGRSCLGARAEAGSSGRLPSDVTLALPAHGHCCLGAEVRSGKKSGLVERQEASQMQSSAGRGRRLRAGLGSPGRRSSQARPMPRRGHGAGERRGWGPECLGASMGNARLVAAPDPVATVPGAGTQSWGWKQAQGVRWHWVREGHPLGSWTVTCPTGTRPQCSGRVGASRLGRSAPRPSAARGACRLTRLDFSFWFFLFFLQEESIPEVVFVWEQLK